MTYFLRRILTSLAALLVAAHVHAFESGWMQIQAAGATPDASTTTVALFYPTRATPRTIPMGPFAIDAAIGGQPIDKVKALILLSHGNAGTELGHSALAQALARSGYLVAALRHPGDNWQDQSLLAKSPERYFDERPRQASRVIDAILANPAWKDRIETDSEGPRVGAIGHSAGGYTVLALAGAVPDLSLMRKHCLAEASDDPIFCGMGRSGASTPLPAAAPSLTHPCRDFACAWRQNDTPLPDHMRPDVCGAIVMFDHLTWRGDVVIVGVATGSEMPQATFEWLKGLAAMWQKNLLTLAFDEESDGFTGDYQLRMLGPEAFKRDMVTHFKRIEARAVKTAFAAAQAPRFAATAKSQKSAWPIRGL